MLHVKRFIGSYKLRFLYLVFSSVTYEDLPETAIKKLPKRPRLRLNMTGLTGTIKSYCVRPGQSKPPTFSNSQFSPL